MAGVGGLTRADDRCYGCSTAGRAGTRAGAAVIDNRGFTLYEILLAIVILTVALLGVTTAVAVQTGGIGSSLSLGHAAVTRGYYVSTATELARERLEEVRQLQYTLTVDQFGLDPIPARFPDENPAPGFSGFSRQVRVQTGVPAPNMKTVTVTVAFNLPTPTGMNQESISITTLVAARP